MSRNELHPQINEGYTIIESVTVGSARFVIGENMNNLAAPYVTWQANIKNDPDNFFWGHYCSTKMGAIADFGMRIAREAEYLQDRAEQKKVPAPEREGREGER